MTAKKPQTVLLHQSSWLWILCLIGLDYFSSLAYQPSIAFEAAGLAAPFATVIVVLVTFLGAFPVYLYVAGRSTTGQGGFALIERSVPGWRGKLTILVLLGFSATDFVMTKTLSIADAAVHVVGNSHPEWQRALSSLGNADEGAGRFLPPQLWQRIVVYWDKQLVVTILLTLLGIIFWAIFRRGFTKHVIQLAVAVVVFYLVLTGLVVGSGLYYLLTHHDVLLAWWAQLTNGHDSPPHSLFAARIAWRSLLSFPNMSLGLSGFELSMVVLPFVKGDPSEEGAEPRRRIRNVRKMLLAATLTMAIYLLGSTLVATTLIPPDSLKAGGKASNRALAYLAHGGVLAEGKTAEHLSPLFGKSFGTLYDISTILILCLAGTSVTLGLRYLVPQYLHRLGMELRWAHNTGVVLYLFNCINLVVTVLFRANVTAQRGAYATSVLVVLSGTALAAGVDVFSKHSGSRRSRMQWAFAFISALFLASAGAAIFQKPDGLLIALCFVFGILTFSIISRLFRSTELRFEGFRFKDSQSQFLWESLEYLEFPVLVPHRPGRRSLLVKEKHIRESHRLTPDVPVVFIEAELGDASDFYQKPLLEVRQEDGRFVIRATQCTSIPHVLAAAALELSKVGKPPEIHFGWSDESPVAANINFLLFGQGNVPWMVRDLIRKAEPDSGRQPRVILG
jgi:hypothetical protein